MGAAIDKVKGFPPRGWRDALLQFGLFLVAYQGYQVVRGLSEARPEVAFANGERIADLESSLGAFFEPGFQQALLGADWLINFANWSYLNTQFVVTTGFIAWLYLFRNEHFYFVRNMFMVAMLLALTGYLLLPTAPPRLVPGEGFVDTIAAFTALEPDSNTVSLLVNKYAAVPSMHIAFSLMVAVPAFLLVRNRIAKALWTLYPLAVLFVVVVTGNHFWLDAAAGAAVAATSAVVAHRLLAPRRPGHWAFREAPA